MTPHFSIVVPTYSRMATLSRLLDLLRPESQALEADVYEVIVSDDAPGDAAREQLGSRFPSVRFVTGPGRGPAANRNAGARYARGEWLVFTDDDCEPCAGWLRALAEEADHHSLDVIEGAIVVPDKRRSIFRRDVENLNGDCFWSANLSIRRECFERLGGFDEDFREAGGEDLELGHRIRAIGARTAFSRQAIVYHRSHVMTIGALLAFLFTIRWHALYQLKTGQTLPLDAAAWRVVPYVIWHRSLALLRTTWRDFRDGGGPGLALSRALLHALTYPLTLPYEIYWELKFRRILRRRSGQPVLLAN
jgi:GT2 family glycosyltransferase